MAVCWSDEQCKEWAKKYMKYCLCNAKDGVSLTLGLISVLSWGVAEIPQIITNYKEKSTESLSIAFLTTWIIGDLFNLFGCMLEPATLPTQYYMAMLYTITTTILAAQTIYYTHINKRTHKGPTSKQSTEGAEQVTQSNGSVSVKQFEKAGRLRNGSNILEGRDVSSPIPFPAIPRDSSPAGELFYTSARSLSRSHTPIAGSFLIQRMTPTSPFKNSIEEPLLGTPVTTRSTPPSNTKTMLCVVSAMTFFGTFTFHRSANNRLSTLSEKPNQGVVFRVARKLLQANDNEGSSSVGTFLGWAMAAIYMGGRLPQICLNIRRGNVEGLNPLMFIFALVGNITYVASILVSSMEWSKIRPNLPWLVDAAGCVFLDTLILIQFIYFRYRRPHHVDDVEENKQDAA